MPTKPLNLITRPMMAAIISKPSSGSNNKALSKCAKLNLLQQTNCNKPGRGSKVPKREKHMEEHIVSQEIVDAVHKEMAKEAGMTLEAFRAMLKQTREDFWCSCEKPGDTIYHS